MWDWQCRQAKLDALAALGAAAEGYGPAALQPHLSAVWQALKGEMLAPAAPGLLPADLHTAQQVIATLFSLVFVSDILLSKKPCAVLLHIDKDVCCLLP